MSAPAELREAAEDIWQAACHAYSDEVAVQIIAAALLSERLAQIERDAGIARNYPFTDIAALHKNGAVATNAAINIADMIEGKLAIRNQEHKP